nr:hypothetical protein GCM10020185_41070 [Pseudomonas brassicacearum subsp. brassicacearum]
MPSTFGDLAQPLDPLLSPRYTVSVNGQTSNLLMAADAPLVWSTDQRALVCLAQARNPQADGDQYWLWQLDKGWRALPLPWVKKCD